MIFKKQLTNISAVLNNTGNTTKLLTSFNALDVAQQKVLLSSSLLSEKQKEQCVTMATLSAANTKYTAEQLAKTTGISTETLANWGLIKSTDTLTISELAEKAASDAQAKTVLDKIIAQNAEDVANGKIIASNTALVTSEGNASLATGTFTTAIKANISAMWTWMTTTPLGLLTLLASGVFVVVKAYDALTVSVKEQKEKMEDSLSAYKDAKSELSNIITELENQERAMDDLLGKEKLTYVEQGQLEELQEITEELRIQKDLAEKEEGRTQKEVAQDASDLFNKQFGKYDISENAINEWLNAAKMGNNELNYDKNNISAMIAAYKLYNNFLDEAYGSGSEEDIDHFKLLIEDTKDSIFDKAMDLQEQKSNIADYYNTIKDIPYENLTKKQKGIVDSYNSISDAIELIYQQLEPNTWKSMQIENVFDTEGIEKTKEELVEMVKAGTFEESVLQSYPKLSEAMKQNKVSANELRNELEALADAQDSAQNSASPDLSSLSSFLSNNENLKQSLYNLSKAGKLDQDVLSSFKEYDELLQLCNGDVDSLIANITQMSNTSSGTLEATNDLSTISGGLDSLSEVYSQAIDGFVESSAIQSLYDQFGDLSIFDSFVEALQNIEEEGYNTADAFNSIADAYISSKISLDNLTDSTKAQYIEELRRNGVTNAETVVEERLAYMNQVRADALNTLSQMQGYAAYTTQDLINASVDEVTAMINSANAAGLDASALQKIVLAKMGVNSVTIDAETDVNNLIEIAKAAGLSESMIAMAESAKHVGSAEAVDKITANLKDAIKSITDAVDAGFSPYEYKGSKGGSKKGSGSNSSPKTSKTEIDWITRKLERLQKIIDLTKAKFDNLFSVKSKSSNLDKQIKQTTKLLEANEKTAKKYKSYADKYAKNSGLSKTLIKKIQSGDYDITKYSSKTAEKINKYKEAYDNYQNAFQKTEELETEIRKLKEEQICMQSRKSIYIQIYDELHCSNEKCNDIFAELRHLMVSFYITLLFFRKDVITLI